MKKLFLSTAILGTLLMTTTPDLHAQGLLDRLKDGKAGNALGAGADAVKGMTLSDAELARIGADAAKAYDAQNNVAGANDPYTVRLNRLVGPYRNDSGLSLNFKVYKADQVNAFALPDGSVRVYSGLMDLMSDDELRFVIGHEIGHVKHGHSKERFRTAYLAQAARKGAAATGGRAAQLASSELGGLVESVVKAQHSQSNELESDSYGLELLQRGKHEPQAAVTALRKLGDGSRKADILSSHPNPERRASRIESQIR